MAEKGAHLSATFVKKPSIFELIAQDALSNTFYPAFKHIANYFVSQNPIKYGFLIEWFEELYLCFNLTLQHYYLKNYDSTFSERFYSLKRITIDSLIQNTSDRLTKKQILMSYLCSVIYPYFKNKLKIVVEKIENEENYVNQSESRKKYQELVLKFYRIFHVIIESICMIYYLRYMIGHSETHSIFLRLAGVTLVYYHDSVINNVCWKTALRDILSGNWKSFVVIMNIVKGFFGRSLELCAFFIQFLSWWHSEQLHSKFIAYPIPPPPHTKIMFEKKCNYDDVCPICKHKFRIPTALPVSGYVFCFKCIRHALSKSAKCPVTNLPANESDLVRIYED